jgi:hypothetical protein
MGKHSSIAFIPGSEACLNSSTGSRQIKGTQKNTAISENGTQISWTIGQTGSKLTRLEHGLQQKRKRHHSRDEEDG